MRLPMLLFALLVLPSGVNAQPLAPAARSRDEVLALPTVEAARALLGDIASRFVTMAITRNGDVPVEVAFATAPATTHLSGLCEATVLRIGLVREEDPAAPPEVRSHSVSRVYRVVGDVDWPPRPPGPDETAQAALCANAGPVLPTGYDDSRSRRFFTSEGEVVFAVAALRGAIRRAREGRLGAIECIRRSALNACANPRAELGALDLADLTSLHLVPQDRWPNVGEYRLTARFVAKQASPLSMERELVIEISGLPLPAFDEEIRYGSMQFTQ